MGTGYFGSKAGSNSFRTIIAQFPPHDTYIEAYLGTGTVLREKPPAARQIGIEIDPETIDTYAAGLPGEIHCGDALKFLAGFDFDSAGRTLVYADPPYLWSTRTSEKRYRHDYDARSHARLLQMIATLPCAVILSGYPSQLYDDALPGWRTLEFQAMTRGGVRTEKLWMNYPAGPVHWATFAGRDRTRRQNIKRKAARWRAKFAAMPEPERLAILAALTDL